MNFTKTMYALAVGSVGIVGALSSVSAHAFAVNNGDALSITLSSAALGTGNSSYFGMDTNGDGIIAATELTRIKPSLLAGTQGIVIGSTTAAGPSHAGNPVGTESGAIDRAWGFFSNTGSDFLASAVTGDTVAGLDFSGWRVTWNGIPAINMGGGLQNCGTGSDGICLNNPPPAGSGVDVAGTYNNGTGLAAFAWNGVYGSTYTIDYTAIVPQGDPSGFGGVHYALHLTGVVTAAAPVPEASTYGMMLAGLGLVGFMARRRTQA
jgi:hypothetical protein